MSCEIADKIGHFTVAAGQLSRPAGAQNVPIAARSWIGACASANRLVDWD
jgi:hypothetical protein